MNDPNEMSNTELPRVLPKTFLEKFKVNASSQCWEWTAAKGTGGSARYRYGGADSVGGKVWYAHAFSWAVTHGENKPGTIVVRICKNKICVNPEHLELTTLAENFSKTNNRDNAKLAPVSLPQVLPDSFRAKFEIDSTTNCWKWKASLNARGYGRFRYGGADSVGGKVWYAHVFSYLVCVSSDTEGLVIDHLCENTSCVNPDHLQAVSHQENIRRIHKRPN
jgi:hypothetical protein